EARAPYTGNEHGDHDSTIHGILRFTSSYRATWWTCQPLATGRPRWRPYNRDRSSGARPNATENVAPATKHRNAVRALQTWSAAVTRPPLRGCEGRRP